LTLNVRAGGKKREGKKETFTKSLSDYQNPNVMKKKSGQTKKNRRQKHMLEKVK